MDMHHSFRQAICENPADDVPRLIYADWLEEHGHQPERAEFIRVQIELAKLPDPTLAFSQRKCEGHGWLDYRCSECRPFTQQYQDELRRRHDEILRSKAGRNFRPGCLYFHNEISWQRGFVHNVKCSADLWLVHVNPVLDYEPIVKLEFPDGTIIERGSASWLHFRQTSTELARSLAFPRMAVMVLVRPGVEITWSRLPAKTFDGLEVEQEQIRLTSPPTARP
jgi:uncharacterized protein (TIGR02996 family)